MKLKCKKIKCSFIETSVIITLNHTESGFTCVDFLERLVGEEAESCVRHDAEDGGSESSVERLQPLLTRDTDEHVQDVTVPDHQRHHTTTTHQNSLHPVCPAVQEASR